MMQFKYRWCYVIFLALSLGLISYLYDLKPRITSFKEWQNRKFTAETNLNSLQAKTALAKEDLNNNQLAIPTKEELHGLADLLNLITSQGVQIQSLKISHDKTATLHFILKGSYAQITAMLAKLSKQNKLRLMTNFNYKMLDKQLVLEMQLLNFPYVHVKASHSKIDIISVQNPFCQRDTNFPAQNPNTIKTTPLILFKMMGYLEQGEIKQAVISGPDGNLNTVTSGDRIAKENWQITNISPQKITLQHNQQQKFLEMTIL